MRFKYGIEHEIAFLNSEGRFADFTNTQFEDFSAIIDELPIYESDYSQLRIGDAGIRHKRWYIEGLERFDNEGNMLYCTPKGIEIRTTIHESIRGTISELTTSFDQLKAVCTPKGFTPILVSYNPISDPFKIDPPFNSYETQKFAVSSVEKLEIPMMTHGPDLNLSCSNLTDAHLIEIARKLVYLSPFIVPFSFSSPFVKSSLWEGLSKRVAYRARHRPAVIVYLKNKHNLIHRIPTLTKEARMDAEAGRIEFKAFDSCGDFNLYASLLVLLKGLILDTTMPNQLDKPDVLLYETSAKEGFDNPKIYTMACRLFTAAKHALCDDPDVYLLDPLERMLQNKETPAHNMIHQRLSGKPMLDVLKNSYN